MTAEEFAEHLRARGYGVQKRRDHYMAQCPGHADPSASLSFRDTDDRVLVNCFADCPTPHVVEAVDLSMADLFHNAKGTVMTKPKVEPKAVTLPSEEAIKAAVERLAADKGYLAKLSEWRRWSDPDVFRRLGIGLDDGRLLIPARNAQGALVGVTHYDPDPSRPGKKAWSEGTRELFPAPELITADASLTLTEGEGDAITAHMLGLVAVGVPGAAWWAGERGRNAAQRLRHVASVYACPDCDTAGRDWARRAADDVAAVGVESYVVDLDPDRDDGFDLTELVVDTPDASRAHKAARTYFDNRAKATERTPPPKTASVIESRWPDPLAEEALTGLAGKVVRTLQPITEGDPAAILIQYLAAFGNAAGRSPHMKFDGSRHGAGLFVVIAGRSARARKGTSWARVSEIMERAAPQWHAERIEGGLSSGEGLVYAVRDPVIERVPIRKARDGEDEEEEEVTGDGYVERVVDPGILDKRLFVLETEFSQVLRVMRRDGNILSTNLRNLWDRGTGGSLTKHSPTKVQNAHVSIVGHIVQDELRREMGQGDYYNGFANRFMFVCARRAQKLPYGGDAEELAIMELAHETSMALDFASGIDLMVFDAEAAKLWERLYMGELSRDYPGIVGAVIARAEPMTARLALIYALLDGERLIRPQHLRAALAVWRYCSASARYLFGGVIVTDADRLYEVLGAGPPEGMTRTAISDALQRHWAKGRIDAALSVLAEASLVLRTVKETSGRPVERWRLA